MQVVWDARFKSDCRADFCVQYLSSTSALTRVVPDLTWTGHNVQYSRNMNVRFGSDWAVKLDELAKLGVEKDTSWRRGLVDVGGDTGVAPPETTVILSTLFLSRGELLFNNCDGEHNQDRGLRHGSHHDAAQILKHGDQTAERRLAAVYSTAQDFWSWSAHALYFPEWHDWVY